MGKMEEFGGAEARRLEHGEDLKAWEMYISEVRRLMIEFFQSNKIEDLLCVIGGYIKTQMENPKMSHSGY